MKDLYSFHLGAKDLEEYYDRVKVAYDNIFSRCGLKALIVEASGGVFSKYSHEFQVLAKSGEDTIFVCQCGRHQNKELVRSNECPHCGKERKEESAIEVGNIFKLKDKFSKAIDFKVLDKEGKLQTVLMGCYGIGLSRLMGTIVEVYHDDKGIIWPKEVAPFAVHLVGLNPDIVEVKNQTNDLYNQLKEEDIGVLYDDRLEATPGEKFSDADLMGIGARLVVSQRMVKEGKVEFKERKKKDSEVISLDELMKRLK